MNELGRLYMKAHEIFTYVSQQIKRTFVFDTHINFTRDKLASFGYRVLRVKEDEEEERKQGN